MLHKSLGPYIKKNFFNAFGVHPGEEKTLFFKKSVARLAPSTIAVVHLDAL
jgi:hypothetical protein